MHRRSVRVPSIRPSGGRLTPAALVLVAAAQAGEALPHPPERRDLPAVLIDQWGDDTEQLVGGGSSLFRQAATDLDVHWRLAAFDGTAPWLDPERSKDLVDLAVIGAGLGVGLTARRLLTEGAMDGLRTEEAMTERAVNAMAELDDPTRAALRSTSQRRKRRPRVQPGASLAFSTSVDPAYWEDRSLSDAAVVTTWLTARDIGPERVRVQLTTRQPDEDDPWEVSWAAVARQGIGPRLSVLAEVRGTAQAESGAGQAPDTLRSALDLRVAPHRPVFLRAETTRRDRGEFATIEHTVGVSLRANLAWRVPVRDDPWQRPQPRMEPLVERTPPPGDGDALAQAEVQAEPDAR